MSAAWDAIRAEAAQTVARLERERIAATRIPDLDPCEVDDDE